jgi:hypothetical protein
MKNPVDTNTTDGSPIVLRLPPSALAQLEAWIAVQPEPRPSLPEAAQRILAEALAKPTQDPCPTISDQAAVPEMPEGVAKDYDGSAM